MKIMIMFACLLSLSACKEAPKHQIVFTHSDTCRIMINDLQFGQANETDRYCKLEKDGDTKIISVNFLSETCNAYRYSFIESREGSEGVYVFTPELNQPNTNCTFLPQYSDPNSQWVLNPK